MDFQQIRDFVNPAVAQATGLQEVGNLSMPVPVAHVPGQLVIDGALSPTSENPVQNKVVTTAIQQLDERVTGVSDQLNMFTALALGNTSVEFTDGVGLLSVDLSAFENRVNQFTILGIFNPYPLEFGVVGGITNDTLSNYTWKLRTVGNTASRTMTIRYCILGKVI